MCWAVQKHTIGCCWCVLEDRLAPKAHLTLLFLMDAQGQVTSVLWPVCSWTAQELLLGTISDTSPAWADEWE